MEDLRGLVSSQGCDDGSNGGYRNPLTKFVNTMWSDNSQRLHNEWKRAPQLNHGKNEATLSTQSNQLHPDVSRMYSGGRVSAYDPLGLNEHDTREIDDFIHGGIHGISPRLKEKLNIAPDAPEEMIREFLQSLPLEEQFHPDFNPEDMANEFASLHLNNEHHQDPHEMERLWHEAQEEHRRAEELEQYYAEANETQNWVDEFEGSRPIVPVTENIQRLTDSLLQIDDPKLQNSNFMKFIKEVRAGQHDIGADQNTENWANEFEQFSAHHPGELMGGKMEDQWAREFEEQMMNNEGPNGWLNEYEQFSQQPEMEWLKEFNSINNLKEYEFSDPEENPYMTHPEPFQKGVELFNEGRLAESILAFEAELIKNPMNSKGWEFLGKAHAENDKDGKAISALLNATDIDPENLAALPALAVSYTNELYRDQALDTLKTWIERHKDYSHLKMQEDEFTMTSFVAYHKAVTDLYIQAARLKPDTPDPDVQTALGLLFNLNLDYAKAVDCFQAALSVRPDDYQLWNKLGATLANSNRSEEAIGCYYEALKIKPSYVRARANLGISYMALQDYEKAATYFLGALSMHPNAKHIWSNLHMVFLSLGREDLIQKSMENEGNVDVFRENFDF